MGYQVDTDTGKPYIDQELKFGQIEVRGLPKTYSQQERQHIIRRLKEEAANCMAQFGIRRTTVDELVRRVKIPKGTFYLFYASKELLLFEVILEQHELIERQVDEALNGIDPNGDICGQLTDMLFSFYKTAQEMPIFKLLNSGEIEILARKLPEDVVAKHLSHDDSMAEKVFALFPFKTGKTRPDPEVFSSALRSIFLANLYNNDIKDPNTDKALRLMIHGLVLQLMQ